MSSRSFTRCRTLVLAFFLAALLAGTSCLPKPASQGSGPNITLYGFSIMKEPLEKGVFPGFVRMWKEKRGQEVSFTSSFAGSETVTNQILQGVKAQVAILSIERDVTHLQQGGVVTSDWHKLPQNAIVNKTPFVILVRKGNPRNVHDFADLSQPGLKLIHPDPSSSGGAQWSILAIYGSELIKSEKETGTRDEARALRTLQAIWRNVISAPSSAREARAQFESEYGDALVTYEIEGLLMKETNPKVEIVVPEATIFSEHPAVVIDRNVSSADRPLIDAFMQYLWTDEAQRAFVRFHFRSSSNEALNQETNEFATIKLPFTVEFFGGWGKAYPDVIDHVFRKQVQRK